MAKKRLRKKIIHVNQHIIRANAKNGTNDPPLTIKEAGKTTTAHQVDILGPSSVINRPQDPLSCGARVWIETYAEIIRDPGHETKQPEEDFSEVCPKPKDTSVFANLDENLKLDERLIAPIPAWESHREL